MRDLFGEAPANRSASWHPPPETRGSFNILISCLITLGLCVWSAVHLNIPEQDLDLQRKWYDPRRTKAKHWRKVRWLVLALLAPEMVAFTAWRQRREAFKLTKHIEDKLYISQKENCQPLQTDEDIEPGSTDDAPGNTRQSFSRRHKWTHVHSFFVLAGGFAVDTSELPEQEKYLPETCNDRVALTVHGVYALSKYNPSLLPDITKEEIMDKSKANGLAKFIICIQVMWFMVQCIARLAMPGCSISLLELNTFAHAACTLLIYGLWWDKPFDVEEPERIIDPRIHDFCAYCYSWSHFDYNLRQIPERSILVRKAQQYVPDVDITSPEAVSHALHLAHAQERSFKPGTSERVMADMRILDATDLKPGHREYSLSITPRHRERWNKADQFSVLIDEDDKFGKYTVDRRLQDMFTGYDSGSEETTILFFDYKNFDKNWTDKQLSTEVSFISGFFLAGLIYGGIHLFAWNAPFTSQTEHFLWKISSLVIASSGPILLVFTSLLMSGAPFFEKEGRGFIGELILIVAMILVFLSGVAFYIFARVYLVVECFISFAYLPESTFNQPQWTAYFPHIQ